MSTLAIWCRVVQSGNVSPHNFDGLTMSGLAFKSYWGLTGTCFGPRFVHPWRRVCLQDGGVFLCSVRWRHCASCDGSSVSRALLVADCGRDRKIITATGLSVCPPVEEHVHRRWK